MKFWVFRLHGSRCEVPIALDRILTMASDEATWNHRHSPRQNMALAMAVFLGVSKYGKQTVRAERKIKDE